MTAGIYLGTLTTATGKVKEVSGMKMSRKLVTILCACLMGFSVTAGLINVHNTNVYTAKAAELAEEAEANKAFKAKVKKYSTYSADVLNSYIAPIWNTDEVVDESATIVTAGGSTQLLYVPIEGSVVIRNYHNEKYYVEGVDFEVDYKTGEITRLVNGDLPYFTMQEYISKTPTPGVSIALDRNSGSLKNDKDLANSSGYSYISYYNDGQRLTRHFNVSYRVDTEKSKWTDAFDAGRNPVTNQAAPVEVTSKAGTYADFLDKLKLDNEATVMFYGDSITFGCNATSFVSGGYLNPYLPRWSELVTQWLEREYGSEITYLNGAVGGWTTTDGVQYWQEAHPSSEMGKAGLVPQACAGDVDLLVLAFGMNDATGSAVNGASFQSNIWGIIDDYYKQRNAKGHTDGAVLLVSNMMPNTQSTWFDNGTKWHNEVEGYLNDVVRDHNGGIAHNITQRIAVAPVGSVFKTFEEKGKQTRNVLGNNINHPTDFGIRVYAQTILQTLTGYADDSVAEGNVNIGNNVIIGEGASVRLGLTEVSDNNGTSFYSGIRYRAYVSEKYFDKVGGNPYDTDDVVLNSRYKAGMWIIPQNILQAVGTELNSYTDENVQKYLYAMNNKGSVEGFVYNPNVKYVENIPAQVWDDRDDEDQIDGYVRFNAAYVNLPQAQFGRDLAARAYILDTKGTEDTSDDVYYISRGWQCRNLAEISSKALIEETNFTPHQQELLEWFVDEGLKTSNTLLPTTFNYNGLEKSLAYPNTTYTCSSCAKISTASELIDGMYCRHCAPKVNTATKYTWCSAANAPYCRAKHVSGQECSICHVTCGDAHANETLDSAAGKYDGSISVCSVCTGKRCVVPHSWNLDTYYHETCRKYYTAVQLLDGVYCPTCVKVANENTESGNKAFITLTKGDTFKLNQSSSGIMPTIMVKENDQWVLFNEVYSQYFNYNTKTGRVTVIDVPKTGVLEIEALITLQTRNKLNGTGEGYGIDTDLSQTWTIVLFNASLNVERNSYLYAFAHVNSGGAGIARSIKAPTFAFEDAENAVSNYAKISYTVSPSNVTVVQDGTNLSLYIPDSNADGKLEPWSLGKYVLTVTVTAENGITRVLEKKQIVFTVEDNYVYDHMIVDTATDQFSHLFTHCGSENDGSSYIWYDVHEQAYRYKTNTPDTQTVTLKEGSNSNRFTEKYNGAWLYPYFLIDVKFNYANGRVVDGNTYNNGLAFDTLNGSSLYFSNDNNEQVRIFAVNDPNATPLSYSEIVSGSWYTVAIPMSKYGSITRYQENTVFKGVGATDMYFANLRFANSVGNTFDNSSLHLAVPPIIEWVDNYDNTGAWRYVATNYNADGTVVNKFGVKIELDANGNRVFSDDNYGVHLKDVDLKAYNELAPQYHYMAIDLKFTSLRADKPAPTTTPIIVFRNGSTVVGYGTNSNKYLIDEKRAHGQVHRNYIAGTNTMTSAVLDTWQTVIINKPVASTSYLFGALNADNGATIPENCTIYFKNIRFLNELDDPIIASPSVNDFTHENLATLTNMQVERNEAIEQKASYIANYGNDRKTAEVQKGAEVNPLIPAAINKPDSTFVSWEDEAVTSPVIGISTNNTAGTWFGKEDTHKVHTTPQSMINYMTTGARDHAVTQYKFTNWGYTYSDKVRFNTSIRAEDISSISVRVYTVLSPYTVYTANFMNSEYSYHAAYCNKCETYYTYLDYYYMVNTAKSTACGTKCGGNVVYSKTDIRGNPFVIDPANHTAEYKYQYDANAWVAAYRAGYVTGVLNANGTHNKDWGSPSYNNYDTSYGGIRFYPYGENYVSSNNAYKGYMLPANVTQGVWTTVTCDNPALWADADGYIRGFWVGQSADSNTANDTNRLHTFINAGIKTEGGAYMNVDSITVTLKNPDRTRVQMATENNLGISPKADITLDGPVNTGISNVNAKAPTAIDYTMPKQAEVGRYEGKNILQYVYNASDGKVCYNSISFKNPVPFSQVDSVTFYGYFGGKTNGFNKTQGEHDGATGKGFGGIFIHAANPWYLSKIGYANEPAMISIKRASDDFQGADNNGYFGYRVNQVGLTGWKAITVPASYLQDYDANGVATGQITGFIIAMNGFAFGSEQEMGYINLDWVEFNMKSSTAQYDASMGYKFTAVDGYNSTMAHPSRERFAVKGTALSNMRLYLPSHKYVKLDVYFENAADINNLVFAQGEVAMAESYYALKGGFTIDVTPVKQALIYLRSEINSAKKKEVRYEDMTAGTWYTIYVPIEYPSTINIKECYSFNVMTYADGTDASCTAWINNIGLASTVDVKLIGDDGTDFDKFNRFVSDNQTTISYQEDWGNGIGSAYKLNADGYVGFSDVAKQLIGATSSYSRMTMEFRLEDYDVEVVGGSWLYNAIFFNKTNTAIGIGEMYADGEIQVDNVARVYDANGNKVDLENIAEDVWYTIEILNPTIDWAFLGSTGTDIYFRNMIWHVGDIA